MLRTPASWRASVDLPDPEVPATDTRRTSPAGYLVNALTASGHPQAADRSDMLSTARELLFWCRHLVPHRGSAKKRRAAKDRAARPKGKADGSDRDRDLVGLHSHGAQALVHQAAAHRGRPPADRDDAAAGGSAHGG